MSRYFPLTRIRTVEVPVGTGDLDIVWDDTLAIAESLAGVLGPIQTQDSVATSTVPDVGPVTVADLLSADDGLGDVGGPTTTDTFAVTEALSGVIGPISAPDTFTATDVPDIGPVTVTESLAASSTVDLLALSAAAADTFTAADVIGEILRVADDTAEVAAMLAAGTVALTDAFATATVLTPVDGPAFADSLSSATTASADLALSPGDTLSWSDLLQPVSLTPAEALAASDLLTGTDLDYVDNPDTVITSTNVDNAANILTDDEGQVALVTVRDGGGLGAPSQTETFDLTAAFGDTANTVADDITSAVIDVVIYMETNNTAGNGGYDYAIEYSLDDGASWNPISTETNLSFGGLGGETAGPFTRTVDITSAVADDWTVLSQLRVRASGDCISGSGTLGVLVSTTFIELRVYRLTVAAQQT